MKSYSVDEEKIKNFIKKYEKENDEIIIHYADGNNTRISNNIDNEKEILNRMKQQVIDAENYKKDILLTIKVACIVIGIFAAGSIGILAISTPFINSIIDVLYLLLGTTLFSSVAYIGMGSTIRKQKEILKDIEKNQLFLENEELFQTKLGDINVPNYVNEKTKQVISNIVDNKKDNSSSMKKPNINDIDKISYDVIYDICNIINNNEEKTNNKKRVKRK